VHTLFSSSSGKSILNRTIIPQE